MLGLNPMQYEEWLVTEDKGGSKDLRMKRDEEQERNKREIQERKESRANKRNQEQEQSGQWSRQGSRRKR